MKYPVCTGTETLFHKESHRFVRVCETVYKNSQMFIHDPAVDAYVQARKNGDIENEMDVCQWMNHWDASHPNERAAYLAADKAKEDEDARQRRILFGIAKRHHIRVGWTADYPDRFDLYRYGRHIGYISCKGKESEFHVA